MAFKSDPEWVKKEVGDTLFQNINGADELGRRLVDDNSYPTNAEVEALWTKHKKNDHIDVDGFRAIQHSLASLREERKKMSDKELKEHAFKGACAKSESVLKTALQLADARCRLGELILPMNVVTNDFKEHSKDGSIDLEAFLKYLETEKLEESEYNGNMKKAFQDVCGSQEDSAKLQSKEQLIKALEALQEPTGAARMEKAWEQHAVDGKMTFSGFEAVVMGNIEGEGPKASSCCSLQ